MTNVQVLEGDALHLLKQVPSNSVDLIIADPPYNLGKDYGNLSDCQPFDDYLTFSRAWLSEAKRVLSPQGTLYVFMGVRFISYLFMIMEQELELTFNSWICWHYTQGIGKKKGFSPRHDDILMFSKTANPLFNLDEVRVPQKYYRERNNMRGANPGDVWQFSHIHYCQANRQNHPTQKPEGLMERMMLASSLPESLVLDPFAGSGTTLRVAQQLGRACIGMEINPTYVAMIHERLATPFNGFDSIDPRMERIPMDLNHATVREAYLQQHETWFLKHHHSALTTFRQVAQQASSPHPQAQQQRLQLM